MSIASRITSIEGHIEDIYDTMALGGDTTSNKNIVNINTEIKREYKDFLANGTDTLWNNWEKVSGTGETLSLTPTIKGRIQTDLKGNTQQNGTPTPDSPIPIQVVSGDNTIKVEGKNMADFPTNQVLPFSEHILALDFGEDKTFTKLTLSIFCNNVSYSNPTGAFIDYQMNGGTHQYRLPGSYGLSANTNNNTGTFKKSEENITFRRLYIRTTPNFSQGTMSVQLERGEGTSYTPYETPQNYLLSLGNIELCKIGTYQDSIVKDNGKWYLNKQIGKAVLDGSESWFVSNTGTANWFYYTTISEVLVNNALSNYFVNASIGGSTTNMGFNIINNNIVRIRTQQEDTPTNFKTWLSTHNTNVYAPLLTPTYTEITDTTLLGQLNNLYNANSYEETTNVSQVNDDMPFILDMTMLKEMS